MSRQAYLIREFLRRNNVKERGRDRSQLQRRAQDDFAMKAAIRAPRGTMMERDEAAGMDALWVRAEAVPEECTKTLLYFHGGAFYSGSSETHKGLAAAISEASGLRALLVDYRMSPEHAYPAAHEDALAAYRWLLAQGVAPGDIALGGDSAGGNLVLSTLFSARDEGLPMPAAAVLLSPWLDVVDYAGDTHVSMQDDDPSIDLAALMADGKLYFGEEPDSSRIRLLERSMAGLPPLFIQTGELEVLLSDSVTLAQRARADGVEATLQVWPELWHVFQALTAILPEARQAVGHIGEFLAKRLNVQRDPADGLIQPYYL